MSEAELSQPESVEPLWQPLSAIDRRVAGVLVEKAKTTPDNYPLTINAIRVGSNQKSNRFPQMQLDEYDVEDALTRLRKMRAVSEIVGDSRTTKYRHLLYAWLGVDKVEMAVMAELLLRGAQTVGELRGRAARMEPIADLSELHPILDRLAKKKMIVFLSPKGRGAFVTHLLYQPSELERVRREHSLGASEPEPVAGDATHRSHAASPAPSPHRVGSAPQHGSNEEVAALRSELAALKQSMEEATGSLRADLDEIRRELGM